MSTLHKKLPWRSEVPRNVCARVLVELDKAWQRGFSKLSQMPQFKRMVRGEGVPVIEPHEKVFRVKDSVRFVRYPGIFRLRNLRQYCL